MYVFMHLLKKPNVPVKKCVVKYLTCGRNLMHEGAMRELKKPYQEYRGLDTDR